MKKVYTFLLSAAFFLFQITSTQSLHAQCWSAVGAGAGTDPNSNGVYALAVYNGDLYAVGTFDSVSGISAANIAKWNGSTWSSVGSISRNSNSYSVYGMAVYNGDLYVGGQIDSVGGVPVNNIARWNGSTWSAVGSGISTIQFSGNQYTINVLATYNGALYAGGTFDSAGGIAVNNIAKWDGSSWSDVAGGLDTASNNSTAANSMYVYNGQLYVGGNFTIAGGVPVNDIAVWNGSSWSALGTGIGTPHESGTLAIAEYLGNIYAASFNGVTSEYSIYEWNGSSWSVISGSVNFGYVFSLLPFDGGLIAAGTFSAINGVTAGNIAKWNGSVWSALNGGVSGGQQSSISAIDTFNARLYVGGNFSQAGSINTLNIAEYTCTTGINDIVKEYVRIYPNPTNGMINISLEDAGQNTSIQIYDLMGKRILRSALNAGRTQVDLTGYPAGTYLYRLSGENGEAVSSGSFIIN